MLPTFQALVACIEGGRCTSEAGLLSDLSRDPSAHRIRGSQRGGEAELSAFLSTLSHMRSGICLPEWAVLIQRSGFGSWQQTSASRRGEPSCFHHARPLSSPVRFEALHFVGAGFHLPSCSSASHRLLSTLPQCRLAGPPLSPALHPLHVPSAVAPAGRSSRRQRTVIGRGVRCTDSPRTRELLLRPPSPGASGALFPLLLLA